MKKLIATGWQSNSAGRKINVCDEYDQYTALPYKRWIS